MTLQSLSSLNRAARGHEGSIAPFATIG